MLQRRTLGLFPVVPNDPSQRKFVLDTVQSPVDLPAVQEAIYRLALSLDSFLVNYLSAVVNTPFPSGDQTSMTLTPGICTHVGNDWYFLAGLPVPVTKDRVADIGMIFGFMKAW